MKPAYYVLQLDTTAARAGVQIIPPGEQYDAVTVISFPAGLAALLAFGANASNKFVPIIAPRDVFAFQDICGNPFRCDEGLFITHNAVVGNLLLLISTGGNPPTP